ncbi:MAG: hypothetical protein AAGB14_07900, partial [Verrucomicrobiota bacterium]
MRKTLTIPLLAALVALTSPSTAAPSGEVFHIPFNTQSGIPATMRDPYIEIDPDGSVTIYQGFFKNFGANGNQIGGSMFYRIQDADPDTGWQSTALGFHSGDPGGNQFWKADIDLSATGLDADNDDIIEYYVLVDFDDSGPDPDDTYIHGG